MHGLKYGSCRFWQRTDSPPGSNMLRLAYADSGSACKLAGVQIIPLPTLANQILARTFFRSVANPFACPAAGKFSRASSAGPPTALAIKFRKSDRVSRRGLFPLPNSASSPAYRLQTAALENQQNSPDLRALDCYSTHSEPWSALAPLNSRE